MSENEQTSKVNHNAKVNHNVGCIEIGCSRSEIDTFHDQITRDYQSVFNYNCNPKINHTRTALLVYLNDIWQQKLIQNEKEIFNHYITKLKQQDPKKCIRCWITFGNIATITKSEPKNKPKFEKSSNKNRTTDRQELKQELPGKEFFYNPPQLVMRLHQHMANSPPHIVCQKAIPSIQVFGSVSIGMANVDSDLDVMIPPLNTCQLLDRKRKLRTLELFMWELKSSSVGNKHFIQNYRFKNINLIRRAKVPIIKLHETTTDIRMDISVLTQSSVDTTLLLNSYLNFDRIRELLFVIKKWATVRKLNKSRNGFLNNYGYTLLFIKFCQVLNPPLLPVLNIMCRTDEDGSQQTTVVEVPDPYNPTKRKNTLLNIAILTQFFDMYARFSMDTLQVDINSVSLAARNNHQFEKNRYLSAMAIVDPTRSWNNVARCFRVGNRHHFVYEMERASYHCRTASYQSLMVPHNMYTTPQLQYKTRDWEPKKYNTQNAHNGEVTVENRSMSITQGHIQVLIYYLILLSTAQSLKLSFIRSLIQQQFNQTCFQLCNAKLWPLILQLCNKEITFAERSEDKDEEGGGSDWTIRLNKDMNAAFYHLNVLIRNSQITKSEQAKLSTIAADITNQ